MSIKTTQRRKIVFFLFKFEQPFARLIYYFYCCFSTGIYRPEEASTGGTLWKRYSKKFCNIHKKTTVLESFLNKVAGLQGIKRDPNTGVFLWILKNFKDTYFEEHLRTAASRKSLKSTHFQKHQKLAYFCFTQFQSVFQFSSK